MDATTMVAAAGIAFAAAMRRSYFGAWFGFARVHGCNSHIQLSDQLANAYDAFARDSPARPNNCVTRSSRFAVSPDISALADSTPRMASRPARRSSSPGGSSLGMAARLASGSSNSMKNCSRTICLELRKRKTRACVVRASPPQCLQAALVNHSPRHPDIEQTANDAFPETAAADLRFQFGDARLQTLAVFRRHLRFWRNFGIRRDADRGLHHGRSIDAEKERFTERFLRVAPLVEDIDDVLRDGLLESDERIVLRCRLALLANLVRGFRDALHGDGIASKGLVRDA